MIARADQKATPQKLTTEDAEDTEEKLVALHRRLRY